MTSAAATVARVRRSSKTAETLDEPAPGPLDPLQLRRALGSFGTGVTVVSTLAPGARPVGVTANSFSSVSLEPPIVLWSPNRRSPSLAAFDNCGRFVVNVLALDQFAVSKRFASSQSDLTPAPDAKHLTESVA